MLAVVIAVAATLMGRLVLDESWGVALALACILAASFSLASESKWGRVGEALAVGAFMGVAAWFVVDLGLVSVPVAVGAACIPTLHRKLEARSG